MFAVTSQLSIASLFSVAADGEQQRRGTYFPQLYLIFSLRRSHHLLISVSPTLLFLLQHRRFAAAAQLLDSPWFSDERLNVYRHHSVSNCLFLHLTSPLLHLLLILTDKKGMMLSDELEPRDTAHEIKVMYCQDCVRSVVNVKLYFLCVIEVT